MPPNEFPVTRAARNIGRILEEGKALGASLLESIREEILLDWQLKINYL